MMDWKRLLSPTRLGCEESVADSGDEQFRSEYQRDFDRIAFSREFRRLQGKTQLFPAPNDEKVHNRLTHSIEASCVGRYLGAKAAAAIGQEELAHDFAAIVSAAALAHDLGNPPFGHSGERAIQDFFVTSDRGRRLIKRLNKDERRDFTEFDGNQMALRMLAYSLPEKTSVRGGKRLTYATLAACVKYPCTNKQRRRSRHKKAGVFRSELPAFQKIATTLGLTDYGDESWSRHPLALLVEAADDIVYGLSDAEDGYKRGLIEPEFMMHVCRAIALKRFKAEMLDAGEKAIFDRQEQIGFLRAKAMNSLILQAADAFGKNQSAILAGTHESELLLECDAREDLARLGKVCADNVYSHKSVVAIEAAGFSVLPVLLDTYMTAVVEAPHDQKSQKIRQTLPRHTAFAPDPPNEYERLLRVLVYVVGMTDRYATTAYRTLLGTHIVDIT
jgi:dGTPase